MKCCPLFLLGLALLAGVALAKRPNVVFILTDNQGAWHLGCYGNPEFKTPHIDQLAREGLRFAKAFANNPVCSPTRATYLTGLTPSQHGIHRYLGQGGWQINALAANAIEEFDTLPEILAGAGYRCGLSGKWHLGANMEPQDGFTFWTTKTHGHTARFIGQKIIEDGEIKVVKGHQTRHWTERGIDFIEEAAQHEDEPFFLFLAYNGPYSLVSAMLEPVPAPWSDPYVDHPLTKSFPRPDAIHPWQRNQHNLIGNITAGRNLAGQVSAVDWGVGEIMATLKRLGIDDDTLVVYAADQGAVAGHHGFWGMGDHTRPLHLRDGTTRIPMIFRHPKKIPAGAVAEQLVTNYDFMPSLLAYLDLPMPETGPDSPGRDFSPLLKGGILDGWEDVLFAEFENVRAVRTPQWKYVERKGEEPAFELFDLEQDPGELDNRHGQKEVAAVEKKLRAQLGEWFTTYAEPEWDLWRGGSTKTRLPEAARLGVTNAGPTFHSPKAVGATAADASGAYRCEAAAAGRTGKRLAFDPATKSLGGWTAPEDMAEWTLRDLKAGSYDLMVEWAMADVDRPKQIKVRVLLDQQPLAQLPIRTTGGADRFASYALGTVKLPAGNHRLSFGPDKAVPADWVHLKNLRLVPAKKEGAFAPPPMVAPEGFVVELAAGPPLVKHPMMACVDERGRMFVAESAGSNARATELIKTRPHKILMLEDHDHDGVYDSSKVFADKLTLPNGACWHDGSLYVCSPPYLWKLTDADGDGVAEQREAINGQFSFNGMSSAYHGPVFGPDGRFYWCGGQHGWTLGDTARDFDFKKPWTSRAPGVFSCKPDGSDSRCRGHGGIANPVEVAFTAEGEVFGTVAVYDQVDGRHDAVLHWLPGAVYNIRSGRDPVHQATSDELLPPLSRRGWVAPAGIMRYRSADGGLGQGFRDDFFFAEFNTHRIYRLEVERDGASFRSRDAVFLESSDPYVHFTDVLEDADGSLLVVDTGAWFLFGCPTSAISRPEIKGGIYRVRKRGASTPAQARGGDIDWPRADTPTLLGRLDDPRWLVRDRAVAALSNTRHPVAELREFLLSDASEQARRGALWAMARRGDQQGLRHFVASGKGGDSERLTAVRALATLGSAPSELLALVADPAENAAIRREAANAIARGTPPGSEEALLKGLKSMGDDRFLRHALVHALMQVDQPKATAAGLGSPKPSVQEATLRALSGLGATALSAEQVIPLLDSADDRLRREARRVATQRSDWAATLQSAVIRRLGETPPDQETASAVAEMAIGLRASAPVVDKVAAILDADESPAELSASLLRQIGALDGKLPPAWQKVLLRRIEPGTPAERLAGFIDTARQRNLAVPAERIEAIVANGKLPAAVRIEAIGLSPAGRPLSATGFELMVLSFEKGAAASSRVTAARLLARSELDKAQRKRVVPLLGDAGPLEIEALLRSATQKPDAEHGRAIVTALAQAPGRWSLRHEQVDEAFAAFPAAVRTAAKPMLAELASVENDRSSRLAELEQSLPAGQAERGKAAFAKATCAVCHKAEGSGGVIGPDLSTLGAVRTSRDLLEAIVYPNATYAREYEPMLVTLKNGEVHFGRIAAENANAIDLLDVQNQRRRLRRAEIERIELSRVSLMPPGLERLLSPQELADLIAYLRSLK